jgi:hypothetical protein
MSNFYATFQNAQDAQATLQELVRGGVRAEDLSLVIPTIDADARLTQLNPTGLRESATSVGDATSFVGRPDDPRVDELPEADGDYSKYTTLEASPISGVDTSNVETDVDSVDQMENSQEEAERMLYPRNEESYGQHERDDADLAMLTGFSEAVPMEDDVHDTESVSQTQLDDALPTLMFPGFGVVIGSGDLATGVLDLIGPRGLSDPDSLVNYLRTEGLTLERAKQYRDACVRGEAMLAVAIAPGSVNEPLVELIAERHHARNAALVGVPRY